MHRAMSEFEGKAENICSHGVLLSLVESRCDAVETVPAPAASARQFGQDIASIQRLGSRSEPLGAGGRTAPAAIVDRQLQNLQQCMNLAPRYRMGWIWIDGGHEVAKGIQRGQPAREKIAIDRAFMEAGRDPKAHLKRQFLQAVAENRLGG